MERGVKLARRKRRRWLRFWSKHYRALPAFHTLRTMERLEGDRKQLRLNLGEVGRIEGVRWMGA